MFTVKIISKDMNVIVLRELLGDVTEIRLQTSDEQRTRFLDDPVVTAALIGAGTAVLTTSLEKILEHIFSSRRQRLQEQLRTEQTEIKCIIDTGEQKFEIIEKFPSDQEISDKLRSHVLSHLETLDVGETASIEVTVLNDLL